jgi:carbon monoxide dehydrogenase subunit G
MHLEETVRIHQPIAAVFKYVTNPTHWPLYRGAIQATSLPAGPLDTGVTFETKAKFLGRSIEQTHEVSGYEPNHRFTHRSTTGSFPTVYDYTFEPAGAETQVTLRLDAEVGGFFKLAGPLVAAAARRQVQNDLATLKDILETQEEG